MSGFSRLKTTFKSVNTESVDVVVVDIVVAVDVIDIVIDIVAATASVVPQEPIAVHPELGEILYVQLLILHIHTHQINKCIISSVSRYSGCCTSTSGVEDASDVLLWGRGRTWGWPGESGRVGVCGGSGASPPPPPPLR